MGKKGTTYIIIAVLALGALMLLQYNKPKEISWFPSYVATHKIPYGTVVATTLMEDLFSDQLRQIYTPPFEFLSSSDTLSGTYLFVNDQLQFNEAELHTLLDWTAKGNTLFLASQRFEEELLDTLSLGVANIYGGFEKSQKQRHQLVNPRLRHSESVIFDRNTSTPYFVVFDTLQTTVFGEVITQKDITTLKEINVLQQPFGEGNIILSTFPEAFTNYFILKSDNKDYTAGLLSYLDDTKPIYLDNHYKSGKTFYSSPMYIFLNTKELKWAYYIALIGALLYVVFEGKRKQRAIPVLQPLANRTLDFTRTISDMYFVRSDQKAITEHKINYFLDWLRSRYYLGSITKEDDFYRNIASRSGNSLEFVTKLFTFMEQVRNSEQLTDADVIKLNTYIQKFKAKADGK